MTALDALRFRRYSGGLFLLAVMTTSGCAGATASTGNANPTHPGIPSPSVSSTPLVTETGTKILIDGTGLSFAAGDGTVLDTVAYTEDPLIARTRLTEWAAAEPTTTAIVDERYCAGTAEPIVRDRWNNTFLLTHISFGGDTAYRFTVEITGAKVGDAALTTPQGFSVGASPVEMIAAIPGVSTDIGSGVTRIYYDQPDAGWTAYAWAFEGQPIQEIRAPYGLEEGC